MIDCFTGGRERRKKNDESHRYLKQWMCSTYCPLPAERAGLKGASSPRASCAVLSILHLEGSQGREERENGCEEDRRVREYQGYMAGEKEIKEDRALSI